MRAGRQGEKRGWILGWSGGFLWVLILTVVQLANGAVLPSLAGATLVGGAAAAIFLLSPWRHPGVRYWKLMLPIYALFFLSVAWGTWIAGGGARLGLSMWSLLLLLPLLLPLYLAGRRTWNEGERRDG